MNQCELQICIECKHPSRFKRWKGEIGGKILIEKLEQHTTLSKIISIRPVACLGNCSHRCRISIMGENRWSWLLGDINPDKDISFVSSFVSEWLKAEKGLIPKNNRSEQLIKKVLGRVPPMNNCGDSKK